MLTTSARISALGLLFTCMCSQQALLAQDASSLSSHSRTTAEVPRFIPFQGVLTDDHGTPVTTPSDVTFALYKEPQSGSPLWTEVQHVQPGAQGNYSVFLGSSNPDGLPLSAFSTTEARWVGVTIAGAVELPRIMFLSVPYALKASDAQTLGGLPASAFLHASAPTLPGTSSEQTSSGRSTPAASKALATAAAATVVGTGVSNAIPLWTNSTTLGNSSMYQTGNNIGIGATVLEGDGISVVNPKAFGAKGDGVTDDTAAISSAIAAITAKGSGALFFPPGIYYSATCGFTISVPTVVYGVGQMAVESSQSGSVINCGSPTANLFNVTTDLFTLRDIGVVNNTTSTAGAAFYVNGTHVHQRVNMSNFSVTGFYDAIDMNVGAYWDIGQFHIIGPVRYGISVNNVLNNDEGDWVIHDGSCVGGAHTNIAVTPGSSACIALFTSGGGKIHTIKSNAKFTNGIYANLANSVQMLMTQLDIENVTSAPIYIAQSWPYIAITDSFLKAPANSPAIYANGLNLFFIGGNILQGTWTAASPAGIILNNSSGGTLGFNVIAGFVAPTSMTGTSTFVTDFSKFNGSDWSLGGSGVVAGSGGSTYPTLTLGCNSGNVATCSSTPSLVFTSTSAGVNNNSSITSDYVGNGLTFKLPRDLAGKGYHFQNNAGTKDLLYLDSITGKATTLNQTIDDGAGNMIAQGGIATGTYSSVSGGLTVFNNMLAPINLCSLTAGSCAVIAMDYFGRSTAATGSAGHGVNFTGGRAAPFDNFWFRNQAGTVIGAFIDTNYSTGNMGAFAATHDALFGGGIGWWSGTYKAKFTLPSITSNRSYSVPDGPAALVMAASLTTTAAATDVVTVQGMLPAGHCSLTATNASAATNIVTTYVSAKAANQVTVAHAATAGMTYDVLCTQN